MMHSNVKTKKGESMVSLYFVKIHSYVNITLQEERELKTMIRDIGGAVNSSGLFLSTISTASEVTSSMAQTASL